MHAHFQSDVLLAAYLVAQDEASDTDESEDSGDEQPKAQTTASPSQSSSGSDTDAIRPLADAGAERGAASSPVVNGDDWASDLGNETLIRFLFLFFPFIVRVIR